MPKENIHIKDVGGFNNLEILFSPGWSTGPEDGPWHNGVSVEIKTRGFFGKDKWLGAGIIQKEQAIKLARTILEHYKDD
jgi:hypothetical protein